MALAMLDRPPPIGVLPGGNGSRAPARPIALATARTGAPLAEAGNRAVRIFQIHYEDWHRPLLDPGFVPVDNAGIPDPLLEFAVFERLAASPQVAGATLWGALSWRFAEKTGMTAADLEAQIAMTPGHDVYFCNPFPQNEALFHNLWVQGEATHPDLLALVGALFAAAGIAAGETALIEPSHSWSTANYFVGSPAFWAAYLPFVRRILGAIDRLPAATRALLHSDAADPESIHGGASYLPFIVERLFPLFMRTDGAGLSGLKLALPADRALDVHLNMLRELKDEAWRQRSPWLAACWVNYRSLYLKQQHGPAWCRRFLRAVTPAAIRFA